MEKTFWSYLRQGMKGRWEHVNRHEDLLGVGIADVSYYHKGNSWIELKNINELPKRPKTGISLGQWHKNGGAQRHFLVKRRGWLFVRMLRPTRYYMLFRWDNLPPHDEKWCFQDFAANAFFIWTNRIDFDHLEALLEGPE